MWFCARENAQQKKNKKRAKLEAQKAMSVSLACLGQPIEMNGLIYNQIPTVRKKNKMYMRNAWRRIIAT